MVRLSGCIIINHTSFPVSLGGIKGEKIFQYFVKEDYLLPHSALAVTNRIPIARDNGSYPHVADCDYFTVDKLNLDGGIMEKMEGFVSGASFESILILDGKGTISDRDESVEFQKGDSFFCPAGSGTYQI